jgi:ABC-type multidrug transport system ATPase subunit
MSLPVSLVLIVWHFDLTHSSFYQLDYLDRESLAALIEALKVFEGGVLVITHNRDFSESLCKEVWAMRDGRLEASGHNWVEGQGSGARIDKAAGEEDDQYDAMGNKIESKKTKKITASDARKVSDSVIFNSYDLQMLIYFSLQLRKKRLAMRGEYDDDE